MAFFDSEDKPDLFVYNFNRVKPIIVSSHSVFY